MNVKTTIAAAVVAFAISALISQITLRGGSPTASVITPDGITPSGVTYSGLLGEIDENIDGLQSVVDQRAKDWLIRMHLGTALFERANLTNRIKDYERLQALLDDTFTMVPAGAGPVALAARFNFSVHRLAEAEKYLDMLDRQAIRRGDDALGARALRAQIALQRGQYDVALAGLTAVAAGEPVLGKPELALYHAKTGDPVTAAKLLEEALEATIAKDPRRRAWLKLQLGVLTMDRGELVTALKHLHEAEAELAGWWLVHESIAELHRRRGEHAKAIAIYEELVATTDLPQHLDSLASLYRHTGQPEKAEELITRAAGQWEQQLARFPESAMGHALQHYLEFGTPERALELALANYKARPGGDAEVSLARAYLRAGQATEALAAAERALATPYRTAKLHDVAAKAHAALGHTAAAEEQVALCLAINPLYTDNDHSH